MNLVVQIDTPWRAERRRNRNEETKQNGAPQLVAGCAPMKR
jgi:hypothetical protein